MTVLSILAALLVLSVLVVIHEFGHYSVARLLHIGVDEFAVGMGPKLISKEHKGIRYSLRAFPIGGFCKFIGEDEELDDPRAFNNQKPWKRLLVILAGPVFNIVTAILLAIVILMSYGEIAPSTLVGQVEANSPAQTAGLQVNDRILAVNGQFYETTDEMIAAITAAGVNEMTLTIEREGRQQELQLTPFYDEEAQRPRIGISFGMERVRYNFLDSVKYSVTFAVSFITELISFLGNLFFRGQGANDIMGPVGTIGMISQVAQQGFENLLRFAILISINLGVMNLIPFPALDGSRALFLIVEWIRGKPINRDREGMIHFIGLVVLMLIMLFFTYKDIVRLFIK